VGRASGGRKVGPFSEPWRPRGDFARREWGVKLEVIRVKMEKRRGKKWGTEVEPRNWSGGGGETSSFKRHAKRLLYGGTHTPSAKE